MIGLTPGRWSMISDEAASVGQARRNYCPSPTTNIPKRRSTTWHDVVREESASLSEDPRSLLIILLDLAFMAVLFTGRGAPP